jgi:hypothetical protein
MVNIVENQPLFYSELSDLLEKLNDENVDVDHWFNASLKPFMSINDHNFLATTLAIKKLVDTHKHLYRLKKVLEQIHTWANSSSNDDVKFLAETARFAHTTVAAPIEAIQSIMNIVQKGGIIAGGDVMKLHKMYSSPHPPHVSLLRSPDVLDHLVSQTYSAGHPTGHQVEKIWLIAYAAFWNRSTTCREDIIKGRKLLTELDRLLERVTSMNQIQDHMLTFMTMIKEPICAIAIQYWLKVKFFDDRFYEWVQFSQGESPPAFHILDEVPISNIDCSAAPFSLPKSTRNLDVSV